MGQGRARPDNCQREHPSRRRLGWLVAAIPLALAACGPASTSVAGTSSSGSSSTASSSTACGSKANLGPSIGTAGTASVYTTVGPSGEVPVQASSISLTSAQIAQLQAGNYTAAMVWHESATFTSAVTAGAQAEFSQLGIKVVSVTQANFDAATQVNQLQTVEAEKPSVILSLPVDAVSEASAYAAVSGQGSKLILLSNVPTDLSWPTQYQGMVTDDLAAMGKQGAELIGAAMHGKGDLGFIYYDANYYVTNERDAAFRSWLGCLYPNIHIVDQVGMADQSTAQTVTTAMLLKYPNITGIYAPYSETPAEGVIGGLRSLGKTGVTVVTDDLDPSIDTNLASGGYLAGVVADQPYAIGETMAEEAGLAILGQSSPKFAVVPALAVTKSNILGAWQTTLDQTPPPNIELAFGG